jgi:hypothetical protein
MVQAQAKLSPDPVPAHALEARRKQDHLRRRSLHAHGHLLHAQKRTVYHDLGPNHFDNRAKGKQVLRLVNRLQNLGFAVQITPRAA